MSELEFNKTNLTENEFIYPLEIKNKEKYYYDIDNIIFAHIGRGDALNSNVFFHESGQLIINAIKLFELGYFDSAFYSLRQSLELTIASLYLISNDEEIGKWKSQQGEFLNQKMVNYLVKHEDDFKDLRQKLSTFFDDLYSIKEKLNKYVHKIGYKTFYRVRNHPIHKKKLNTDKFISEFEGYLCSCIGAIAMYRLSIDPFPILLGDEKIYNRLFDMMCEAYPDDFINKYLGKDVIEKYKQTKIYQGYYESIMEQELQNEYVSDIIHNQFINREKKTEIEQQIHLLNGLDRIAFDIIISSSKIAKIYCYGGWLWYFCNTKSLKKSNSLLGEELFKQHFKGNESFNIVFQEVYLSRLIVLDENIYIEHNFLLDENEISTIENIASQYNETYRQLQDEVDKILREHNIIM